MMEIFNDKSIYDALKSLGIVRNQSEFSALCGRCCTWYSCLAAKNVQIGIEALGVLTANIIHDAQAEPDADRRKQLEAIAAELWAEMGKRCCDLATAWRIMDKRTPRRGLRHAVNIKIAAVMREMSAEALAPISGTHKGF